MTSKLPPIITVDSLKNEGVPSSLIRHFRRLFRKRVEINAQNLLSAASKGGSPTPLAKLFLGPEDLDRFQAAAHEATEIYDRTVDHAYEIWQGKIENAERHYSLYGSLEGRDALTNLRASFNAATATYNRTVNDAWRTYCRTLAKKIIQLLDLT